MASQGLAAASIGLTASIETAQSSIPVLPNLPGIAAETAPPAVSSSLDSAQASSRNPLPAVEDASEVRTIEKDHEHRLNLRQVRPSARILVPPPNFGLVEDKLYRSGQPSELNFPFLEKLKLKSIVWLAPEDPSSRFMNFLQDQEIQFYHLGVENAVNYDPITEEVVLQALDIVINPSNSPLMVMCNLGRHRTGTVVGIFRKLQRWNLASILEEYRRYAGPKVRVLNEQFIELFDCDLVSVPLPP